MKNTIANLSLVFMLSMALVPSYAENLSEQVADNGRSVNPYEGSFSYEASSPVDIQLPNFSLTADSGSLLHGVDIQVSMLPYKSGMMLQSNMENVCLLSDGVRLLPNGEHFPEDAPALVTLAYDPARIPMGYDPTDIYTYYSDDNTHWHRLERAAVDTVAHTIISYTTHFTDFANAVIKVPEMPESKAYIPTTMTDLPDVDPMQGIPMVEAPTANNRGTAELTYPIELPKGRHGMQPNVDLHYSSAGGNGILGVGWSLSTPAITIDTRWGVPRYDPIYETEQYLVNGAPILFRDETGMALSLPYQSNQFQTRSAGHIRFYARDTKNQDRIFRIGTNPTDYWWAVTDRNGVTTYYGRTFNPEKPDDESIDESSVVRTDSNCIAYWAATASVDVYGNYIRYENEKTENNIYVKTIDYTGNCNKEALSPTYRIRMGYKSRPDVSTNGRLGVLQREEKLLCHVLVQYLHPDCYRKEYCAENLTAYYMKYSQPDEGNLYKSRLEKVIMLDSVRYLMLDNMCALEEIISGRYMRYNEILLELAIKEARDNGDGRLADQLYVALTRPYGEKSIPASETQFSYSNAPSAKDRFNTNIQQFSNLSQKETALSKSTGWSLGGTLTVGPGFDIKTTIFSGGANYDFSRSQGECQSMLLDLNGDGLQDLVFGNGDTVWYCRQKKNGSKSYFDDKKQLHGLTRLSHEVSDTHTWGLQLSFGADLSYSNPMTTSYTDVYFSDVNADGLPDMIDGDYIKINHLDENGDPYFGVFTGVNDQTITVHNSCSEKRIIMDGEVDENIECELREVPVGAEALKDKYKPIGSHGFGAERIDVPEITYPKKEYTDGGILDIQEREVVFNEIDERTFETPKIESKGRPRKAMKNAGSTESSDSEDDLIYRIVGDSIKIYRLDYSCHPVNPDPKIEIVRVWVAPKSDTITLVDSIMLIEDRSASRYHSRTADGVTYSIQHCHSVKSAGDSAHLYATSYSLLEEGVLDANDYDHVRRWESTFMVQKGDVLMFRLRSGENNRFDKTNWHHVIQYSGESEVYDSRKDFICTGDGYFQAYREGEVILSFTGKNEGVEPVVVRVMKNNQLHKMDTLLRGAVNISLPSFKVDSSDNVYIRLGALHAEDAEPRWSDIHLYPKLQYITGFPRDSSVTTTYQDTVVYYPDVQIPEYSSVISDKDSPYRKLFGTLHKGWGGFAYQLHNKDSLRDDIIILDSLVNTQLLAVQQISTMGKISTDTSFVRSCANDSLVSRFKTEFAQNKGYDPLSGSSYWVPMRADSRTEQYIAYGNMGCFGKSVHSNAREITMPERNDQIVGEIAEYDSSLPFKQGETRKNNFVRKQSYSSQHSISWGAFIMNESLSFGSYSAVVDYMDMNGDGYPDFVGKDGIQYSMPWGGIGRLMKVKNFSSFNSATTAIGVAFSACPAQLKKKAGNNPRDGKFHLDGSMGASMGEGTSSTKVQFADVNADGLPDKIDVGNGKVYYNLGYQFSAPEDFGANVSEGISTNGGVSGSLGTLAEDLTKIIRKQGVPPFSIAQVSISGGVGRSSSTNETQELLIDINGDGLPDKLSRNGYIYYNKGNNQFVSGGTLSGISSISQDITEGINTTLGVTCGISFAVARIDFGIQSSPYSISLSDGQVQLTDMDGDGLVDYVYKDSNGGIRVRYNNAPKVNLLTGVTNPTGQSIRMDYTLSEPTSAHRGRQWNLSHISCQMPNHPMPEMRNTEMQIEYDSAYYDNYEKTDYGYEQVTTITNHEKVTRSIYHNHSFLLNGELIEDSIMDMDNNMYVRHFHGMTYKEIGSDKEHESADICADDANTRVSRDGYWTEYYEGESNPQITTYYDIVYDRYHNMIQYNNEGDLATTDDDWVQDITYLNTTANNMISLPIAEQVLGKNGTTQRISSIKYSRLGEPALILFKDKKQGEATTQVGYDYYGNVEIIYAPEDVNKKTNWSAFTYDSITHSHIIGIDNPFKTKTHTEYDYRWGLPTKTTDPAGYEIRYKYDYKGRLEKVIAPREIKNKNDYTVKYTYNLINHNLRQDVKYPFTHVTKDMYDSLFVQREVSIYDPSGRTMQKKHFAEVHGKDMWVVDGAEEWDSFGRVIHYGFPFEAQRDSFDFEPINNPKAIVETNYDVLDRPVVQVNADGSAKYMLYNFNKDKNGTLRFSTQTKDENKTVTELLTSPQEWTIQQTAGDSSSTFFQYSPIGELLQTTDADGYSTFYQYDGLGRLISRIHPDAGETRMEYDLAGNMIAKQTANLAVTNDTIQYHYDFGRLMNIHYPHHPENDVRYIYDSAGRVARREDGTGSETFLYDELGNLAQSLRRIIIPTENQTYMFKTQYKYDSFGRMRNIIYPDGEVVHYGYATGGLLKNVAGLKQGKQNIYLLDRLYDEQGRKAFQQNGNGVWTQFTYDPQRQWLREVHTELPSGDVPQDLHYSYDPVGNITEIDQQAPQSAGTKLGGLYDNHYQYDKQYRLTKSYGKGDFIYNFSAGYSPAGRLGNKNTTISNRKPLDLLFGYDPKRMTHQPRTMFDWGSGRKMEFFWDANGNLAQMIDCKQNSGRLHEWDEENRLRFVLGDKHAGYYGYDGNGERVYKLTGTSSIGQINAGTTQAKVLFDDAVLYPNPYMVVTPKGYTKHYYAGAERLATVIGGGGFGDMESPIDQPTQREQDVTSAFDKQYQQSDPFWQGKVMSYPVPTEDIEGKPSPELEYKCKPTFLDYIDIPPMKDFLLGSIKQYTQANGPDKDVYFTHSDHLGSANWITDGLGKPIQYIHYAPYGELIDNQHASGSWYDERYKFTGKERDWETCYDYFGARYLWSAAGHWLSVDPLADKYPGISAYAYCAWNPIKYVDPNGEGVFPSKEALRQAGENVVNNPNYQRQGRTTFCNIGAQAINAQAGDRSLLGRANEMGTSLRNPEIATEISQSEALEYANMGAVVFASYVSNGGEPGHIAVVAPTEGLTYSATRNESVVSVFNVGSQNGEMPLSYAFGKRSVGLFILNNDLNTLKGISTSNGGNFQEIPVGGIKEIVVTGTGTAKLEVPIKAIDVKSPNANLNL